MIQATGRRSFEPSSIVSSACPAVIATRFELNAVNPGEAPSSSVCQALTLSPCSEAPWSRAAASPQR